MKQLQYPTPEMIIRYNIIALSIFKVKKKDKPEVMSHTKITMLLNDCKNFDGDLYDKATFLMRSLVQNHPFASGNRRTAFIAAAAFVESNGGKFSIKNDPSSSKVMIGIRENHYKHEEIKHWIKTGEIHEFERGTSQ